MRNSTPDHAFIILSCALIIVGLFILNSASYFVACEKFNDCYFYLKHQIFYGLFPGLVFFFFFYFFNYKNLKKFALPALLFTIFLLLMVFMPYFGFAKGEATRWIKIGAFVFQPSEIIKLSFLIYLSAWLAKNIKNITSFKKVFLPFVIILSIISLLILKQPDIGTLIVIFASAMVVYFVAGGRLTYIASIIGVSGLLGGLFIKITGYNMDRIRAWLDPSYDPLGVGYHINQATLAISSGKIIGRGLGHSFQKIYHLPEVISDSIFAVMAEEIGFIMTTVVICIYMVIAYRIFFITVGCKDEFAKLLLVGIGFWFIFQTIINMATMLGLFPLTGIPLPFIGYGGSNLAVFLMAFGIVANISRQVNKI